MQAFEEWDGASIQEKRNRRGELEINTKSEKAIDIAGTKGKECQ